MELKADYRGELTQRVRIHLGKTQKEMGAMFGLSLRAWQDKEQGANRVSTAELLMFQLLLNEHPDYLLIPRLHDEESPSQKAAQAALSLAQYLCESLPMPSKAEALYSELESALKDFKADWMAVIDKVVGDALPDENAVLNEQLAAALAENATLKQQLKEK